MKTLVLKKNDIDRACDILNRNGILSFPTDTVFGLAVRYDRVEAIENLRIVKQRPEDKPFALMVSSLEMIETLAVLNNRDKELIRVCLPGDITLIFNKKEDVKDGYFKESKTIAFRIPNDDFILPLIHKLNCALLVPSANLSGEEACISSDEVYNVFNQKIEGIVEGITEKELTSAMTFTRDAENIPADESAVDSRKATPKV